ncbi:flagella synthesis protein FlgN [Gilliamella sp. wkB112]|uniref:flagella synthesis protein FlgN n=1 Tax=Gilliamella sp. wkB112 TaxID=3120257 RepID=UPI00080DE4D2|nr:flagellar export chaperone FlgN [Gilliamella apicola]OCG05298.1 hypothetical protein A9G12_06125 [Gilliamella apicola]
MLELDEILNKISAMLPTIAEVLQNEQQLLINHSLTNQLNDIINNKNQLLIQLKLLDDQRVAISKQYNLKSPYSDNPKLASQWQSITATTKLLAKINRDNGLLIQKRIDKTQQAINYLRNINNPVTYTNNGYQQTEIVAANRVKV